MRKITVLSSCICLFLFSCGNNPKVDENSREALKNKITEMEDSISALQKE